MAILSTRQRAASSDLGNAYLKGTGSDNNNYNRLSNYGNHHPRSTGEVDDELMFGDFCFTCGNATQGSPYCSTECRKSDAQERNLQSPDYSPALSPVPPLISSAKSVCSSPPSSANNSPLLPLNGVLTHPHPHSDDDEHEMMMAAANEDPPRLDLPAPVTKLDYGASSLPISAQYPHHHAHTNGHGNFYAITYAPESVTYSSGKELKSGGGGLSLGTGLPLLEDLKYRRRPGGRPTQAVPAPLYFRQTAAAVHASPALTPSSPPSLKESSTKVFSSKVDPSISGFELPLPLTATTNSSPEVIASSGGEIGTLRDREMDTVHKSTHHHRRYSERSVPSVRPLATTLDSPDLLLSPRIRALRAEETSVEAAPADDSESGPMSGVEKVKTGNPDDAAHENEDEENDAHLHSAFACYLFSHLSTGTTTPPEPPTTDTSVDSGEGGEGRRRDLAKGARGVEEKRSLSIDSSVESVTRRKSSSSASARLTRFLFGRGRPTTTTNNTSTSQVVKSSDDSPSPLYNSPRIRTTVETSMTKAHETTVSEKRQEREKLPKLKLVPGHFISATMDTPGSSPFPSAPNSPQSSYREEDDRFILSPSSRGRAFNRRVSEPAVSYASSKRVQSDIGSGFVVFPSSSPPPPSLIEPRGRSQLRGPGAVKRDFSPTRDDQEDDDDDNEEEEEGDGDVLEESRGRKALVRRGRSTSRTSHRSFSNNSNNNNNDDDHPVPFSAITNGTTATRSSTRTDSSSSTNDRSRSRTSSRLRSTSSSRRLLNQHHHSSDQGELLSIVTTRGSGRTSGRRGSMVKEEEEDVVGQEEGVSS